MRLALAIKTLFRSPLKTLLTFVLLAAASFMLVYNLSDYAMTTREFQRAVSNYRGVVSVEYGYPERPEAGSGILDDNRFLLSDARSPVSSYEFYLYDDYHQKSILQSDIDAISSLPYVSSLNERYMTAGISTDFYRMDNIDSFFNYTARFVYEATYIKIDNDSTLKYYDDQLWGDVQNLLLGDIEVLSGNPDWLLLQDSYHTPEDGQCRVQVHLPSPEYYERYKYVKTAQTPHIPRWLILYGPNNIERKQIESLIPGERYVFVGRLEPKYSSGRSHCAIGDDTLIDWWPYIYPLVGQQSNYLELDEFAPLRELIQVTNNDLHTFDVVYTDDMGTIRRVAEEKILISEGRLLTPEDSESQNKVCVVSDAFMKEYRLELGDTVKLKLGNELFEQYAPLGAVASARARYANEFVDAEFEIVGAYIDMNINKMREKDLYWAYSDNTVFVPSSFLPMEQSVLDKHEFKPGEVSFVVGDARNIRAFAEECIPKLEEMGLTVYFSDGGWLNIEEQFMQTKTLSLSKLLAFVAASALAIALMVYLFIGRKKREYAIMRALGTTKRRASRTLFVPLTLVAVIAILLGSAAAIVYAGQTAADSLKAFADLGLKVDSSIPASVAVFGVLGALALVLLLAAFGLYRIGKKPPLLLLQENTNRTTNSRKKKIGAEGLNLPATEHITPAAVVSIPAAKPPITGKYGATRHVLGYIAKHGRRALAKTLLALALAALLSGAMGQFTAVRQSYDVLYHNITVKARFINGFPLSKAIKVADSGYAHSPYYEYLHKEGEVNFERTEYYMTSDIRRVTDEAIEFLEGYDVSSVMMLKEKICVLPDAFMETLGLELGDKLPLNEWAFLELLRYANPVASEDKLLELYDRHTVSCKIVGRIMSDVDEQTVYVPVMAADFFRSILGGALSLDLAEYILTDYHMADEFRTYAQEAVDSVRTAPPLFIMDTGEADNIYKIYKLIETLYPIAMVVAILIGSILPGLIIIQSAKEVSIMRVLGTTKKRTRIMLILEQLMLCLLGLIVAFVLLTAVNGTAILDVAGPLGLYCSLHFAGCAASSAVCAVVVTRRKILELLQVKE